MGNKRIKKNLIDSYMFQWPIAMKSQILSLQLRLNYHSKKEPNYSTEIGTIKPRVKKEGWIASNAIVKYNAIHLLIWEEKKFRKKWGPCCYDSFNVRIKNLYTK